MGKFDGVLLCCDIDGTLAVGREIPESNKAALATYTAEGGLLSLCSGRATAYLQRLEGVFPNAPYIAYNGTQIYDGKAEKVLWQCGMREEDRFAPARYLLDAGVADVRFYSYFSDGTGLPSETLTPSFDPARFREKTVLKNVYVFPDAQTAEARQAEMARIFPQYTFRRSWPEGVEQINPAAGKGVCVKRLKAITGAGCLVCVGDQEIDHPMLEAADLAFAPENATPATKRLARAVISSVERGSLADLIAILPSYL